MASDVFTQPPFTGLYQNHPVEPPRGLVYIAHGMGEHAGRYERFMDALAEAGYRVMANDHLGHGPHTSCLGEFGDGGWAQVMKNARNVIAHLTEQHPNVPLFLMGHSMGAMLVQQMFHDLPDQVKGIVLSGSPGRMPDGLYRVLLAVLKFEHWRLQGGYSPIMDYLIFGASNRDFAREGDRTGYEWLSRDRASVAAYHHDPLCGFVPDTASLLGLFSAEAAHWQQSVDARLRELPVYLVSGDQDPVHNQQKYLAKLIDWIQGTTKTLDIDLYPGARHEVLHEINRVEVTHKIIDWLNEHTSE
jgi:alpha-beta hydrolase superfamily lysophospholipase